GVSGEAFTIANAMQEFGFTLNIGGIIIFGIQLFLTIAIGLAISLILGATVNDTKSVQTVTLPIMMVTMIPFFVTMFADVNSLPTAAKLIMYLIPFTHTYTAMSNLMFGHTALLWGGLIYQLIFFAVCMYLAVKVFTTDLLFTMNLNFMKAKKKAGASGNENA
ncbi:MAG: ABC transporter permease, partial [Huintestinicola sp.]